MKMTKPGAKVLYFSENQVDVFNEIIELETIKDATYDGAKISTSEVIRKAMWFYLEHMKEK